jgi:hypothetical protein
MLMLARTVHTYKAAAPPAKTASAGRDVNRRVLRVARGHLRSHGIVFCAAVLSREPCCGCGVRVSRAALAAKRLEVFHDDRVQQEESISAINDLSFLKCR